MGKSKLAEARGRAQQAIAERTTARVDSLTAGANSQSKSPAPARKGQAQPPTSGFSVKAADAELAALAAAEQPRSKRRKLSTAPPKPAVAAAAAASSSVAASAAPAGDAMDVDEDDDGVGTTAVPPRARKKLEGRAEHSSVHAANGARRRGSVTALALKPTSATSSPIRAVNASSSAALVTAPKRAGDYTRVAVPAAHNRAFTLRAVYLVLCAMMAVLTFVLLGMRLSQPSLASPFFKYYELLFATSFFEAVSRAATALRSWVA